MPTFTVNASSGSWVDTGVVLAAGDTVALTAAGEVIFKQASNPGTDPGFAWYGYPEGAYDAQGTTGPFPPTVTNGFPQHAGAADPASAYTSAVGQLAPGSVPFGLALAADADGVTLPGSPSVVYASPGRAATYAAADLGGAGKRLWLAFNDIPTFFADNTGTMAVTVTVTAGAVTRRRVCG